MIEGVIVSEYFLPFAKIYGIENDPFIQEVLNHLLMEHVLLNPGSPVDSWSMEDAEEILEALKSQAPTEGFSHCLRDSSRQF